MGAALAGDQEAGLHRYLEFRMEASILHHRKAAGAEWLEAAPFQEAAEASSAGNQAGSLILPTLAGLPGTEEIINS
jgi:hypothetical protein